MKKNGFTLVELLAVIAILSILVAIVMPNILDQYNETKVNLFVTETQTYMDAAKTKYLNETLNNGAQTIYFSSQKNEYLNTKELEIDTKENEYFIEMDRHGNFKRIVLYNDNYCYDVHTNYGDTTIGDLVGTKSILVEEQLKLEKDIVNSKHLYMSGNDEVKATVKIEDGKVVSYKVKGCEGIAKPIKKQEVVSNIPCTYTGELTQGSEYVFGSYTYRYKQEMNPNGNTWENISTDGWGVVLTDKTANTPVTDSVCESISSKPIVSMSAMFKDSHAQSVDLSNINTSNVVNMRSMFENSLMETLNVSKFDINNVTNMSYMFAYSKIKELDIENWNIKNTVDVTNMFKDSSLEELRVGDGFSYEGMALPPTTLISTIVHVSGETFSQPAASGGGVFFPKP